MKRSIFLSLLTILIVSVSINVFQFRALRSGRFPDRKKNSGVQRKKSPEKNSSDKKAKPDAVSRDPRCFYMNEVTLPSRESNVLYLQFSTQDDIPLPEKSRIKLKPEVPFTVVPSYSGAVGIQAEFQPETLYTIRIAKGLRDVSGNLLKEDAIARFRIPPLSPEIRFLTFGLVLPSSRKNWEMPVRLTSVSKLKAVLKQYYDNNFVNSYVSSLYHSSRKIAEHTFEISLPSKKRLNYAVDLTKLIPDRKPGIYELILSSQHCDPVSTTIVITDLAVQTVNDSSHKQLFAAVRTLSSGAAVPDASAELYSMKNQLLASGKTSPEGILSLDYSQTLQDKEDYPKYLFVRKGADRSRLDLWNDNDLSHFAMNGNTFQTGPKAFVFAERGICRPGEKLHVFAVLRNEDLSPLVRVPCVWELCGPRGETVRTLQSTTDSLGLTKTVLDFPEELPTGRYTFRIRSGTGESAGSSSVIVAQYVPDRIKVSLQNAKRTLSPGVSDLFRLSGDYYFGQDAGDLPYSFTLAKAESFQPYPGWNVGDPSAVPNVSFSKKGTLSAGKVSVEYPGCSVKFTPLRLCFEGSVQEPGGRAVTARTVVHYDPSPVYLALRKNGKMENSKEFPLEWAIFPAEKGKVISLSLPEESRVTLRLTKLEWKYQLKKEAGRYTRQWEKVRQELPAKKLTLKGAGGTELLSLANGEYELTAECGELRTKFTFWHWHGDGGARSKNPAVLSFSTDKETYLPGENVSLTFQSSFSGSGILCMGENRLISMKSFPVRKGKNTLSVSLPADLKTGSCFLSVTIAGNEKRNFGVLRLKVDQEKYRMNVNLQLPEKARSGEKVPLKLTLSDKNGQPLSGIVQLFAVDEGILALTAYKTPDPFAFFRGTYQCPFVYSDLYSGIYPWLKISGNGKTGGGDTVQSGSALLRGRISRELKSFAPAVVVLDTLSVKNGQLDTTLPLPEHTGALRLMAVTLSEKSFGSAEKTILLHDAVSILSSVPRALVPGDVFEASFTLFNHDVSESSGTFSWSVNGRQNKEEIVLKKGSSLTKRIRLCAEKNSPLEIVCEFRMGAHGKKETLRIPVRPAIPPQRIVQNILLKPGESWDGTKPADQDSEHFLKLQSGIADLSVALNFLNEYPYGCLEQTVSTAFPLLAGQNLVMSGVIGKEIAAGTKRKIRAASEKLRSMQLANGTFAAWPDSSVSWENASVFAAHYLLAAGEKIPAQTIRFLGTLANDGSKDRFDRAYACFVLAAAGKNNFPVPARGILAEEKTDFASLLAAGAMIRGGYAGEGMKSFREAVRHEVWRECAHSYADSAALAGMTLYLFQDILPQKDALKLALYLAGKIRPDGTWGTTHANAWAVLGLSSFTAAHGNKAGSAQIRFGTKVMNQKPGEVLRMKYTEEVKVSNNSKGNVLLSVTHYGTPEKSAEKSEPLPILREYLNAEGKRVSSAKQGELLTVRITIHSPGKVPDLVIADLLPGGFEIEDSVLATRASAKMKKADPGKLLSGHTEKRDDRFLFFGSFAEKGKGSFSYQIRAVTRGKFRLPAVRAEAMYDPQLCGTFVPEGSFEVK